MVFGETGKIGETMWKGTGKSLRREGVHISWGQLCKSASLMVLVLLDLSVSLLNWPHSVEPRMKLCPQEKRRNGWELIHR